MNVCTHYLCTTTTTGNTDTITATNTTTTIFRVEALRRVEHDERNQNNQVQSVSEKNEMSGCVFCTTMKENIARKHMTSHVVCTSYLRSGFSSLRKIYFHLTFSINGNPHPSKI